LVVAILVRQTLGRFRLQLGLTTTPDQPQGAERQQKQYKANQVPHDNLPSKHKV
jgi:hypothetical protein